MEDLHQPVRAQHRSEILKQKETVEDAVGRKGEPRASVARKGGGCSVLVLLLIRFFVGGRSGAAAVAAAAVAAAAAAGVRLLLVCLSACRSIDVAAAEGNRWTHGALVTAKNASFTGAVSGRIRVGSCAHELPVSSGHLQES